MNYTKILALISGALLGMSSCTSSSDLNQLPGAAIRTQQALNETVSKLEGHEGYWRLTYYPDTKRVYGGYTMYVQFKDGRVKAISELSTEETNSTYAVKNIDMPTLAFDTRSDILHHFITSTEYFRNARGGDFELLLMGQRGDSILLQGRKYRNLMSLVPIKGDPRQEIASIQQTTAKLQGKGLTPVTIGSAGTVELRSGNDKEATKLQVAFHYTPEGLLFYEPITIGGVTLSGFRLSSDAKQLTSIEGDVTTNVVALPFDLVGKSFAAYMEEGFASPTLITYFGQVNAALKRARQVSMSKRFYFGVNTAADQAAGLKGNDTQTSTFITLPIIEQADGSYTRLSYETDFVPVGSDPKQLDIIARDGNESSWWYWYAGSADYIIRRLASRAPYRTEAFTDDNGGSYYRCTSTKDDKTWFYLYEVK